MRLIVGCIESTLLCRIIHEVCCDCRIWWCFIFAVKKNRSPYASSLLRFNEVLDQSQEKIISKQELRVLYYYYFYICYWNFTVILWIMRYKYFIASYFPTLYFMASYFMNNEMQVFYPRNKPEKSKTQKRNYVFNFNYHCTPIITMKIWKSNF